MNSFKNIKQRFSRWLFFYLDKLSISRGERRSVSILIVLLLVLMGINAIVEPESPFNDEYYSEIEQAFKRRTAMLELKQKKIMARYKGIPASKALPDTVPEILQVNINKAGIEKLKSLPGIGEAYAQNIINYRKQNGPFTSKQELLNVTGIGNVRLAKIKAFIVLGNIDPNADSLNRASVAQQNITKSLNPKRGKPVAKIININTADAQTLATLPGIGQVYAQNIISYRSKNGPFESKNELLKVTGIGDTRLAQIKPLIILGNLERITDSLAEDLQAEVSNEQQKKGDNISEKIDKPASELININAADAEMLEKLPGIGPSYAQNIISYRTEHGKFTTYSELLKVDGIGEATLKKLKPLITLGTKD